jgi:hypothetical protein
MIYSRKSRKQGVIEMKLDKALRREKKQSKNKNGMQVSNRSIFTIVKTQVNRAAESDR